MQHLGAGHSHTTGSTQAAAAAAAGQGGMQQARHNLCSLGSKQQLQPVELGGADQGSGTETEARPEARRKRLAGDSLMQRDAKRRAEMGSRGSHDAAVAAEGGRNTGEGRGAMGAGTSDGTTGAAKGDVVQSAQQRRVLKRRKALYQKHY